MNLSMKFSTMKCKNILLEIGYFCRIYDFRLVDYISKLNPFLRNFCDCNTFIVLYLLLHFDI